MWIFFIVSINILKLIIGLTIFRRWRAVHGAEEHPSPSGFAMVFQKAPFSPKSNANTAKNSNNNPSGSITKTIGSNSGGSKASKSPNASVVNNNVQANGSSTSTQSEGLSKMVIFYPKLKTKYRKYTIERIFKWKFHVMPCRCWCLSRRCAIVAWQRTRIKALCCYVRLVFQLFFHFIFLRDIINIFHSIVFQLYRTFISTNFIDICWAAR